MADHTVELEAKLNTQQAEQKLNQLNAKAEKTVAGPGGEASVSLDRLGDSLKNLKRAVGGGLIASSLGNLAKQMEIFGDQTAQIVGQMQGSIQRLATAAATANPTLVGLVGAIEALSMIATISAGADKLVAKKVKGKFVNKSDWDTNAEGYSQYQRSKEMRQTLASGSKEAVMSLLSRRTTEQSDAKTNVESLRDNGKKQVFAEALKNLEKLDLEIDALQQKWKQLNDEELRAKQKEAAETKRLEEQRATQQADLDKVRSDWRYGEDFAQARRTKNVAWLQESMNNAAQAMRTATTASGFREAWSRYGSARSALQGIDEEKAKEAKRLEKEKAEAAANAAAEIKRLEKQQADLDKVRSDWRYGEDFAQARRTKNVAWLQDSMNNAAEAMRTATTAAEFREASSRYGAARSALQGIDEEGRKTEIERLQGLLDSMKASPVSNYTAAGFSMGEQLGTEENISRNVEQIVRLLQEQMAKQLQTFNLGQGTI